MLMTPEHVPRVGKAPPVGKRTAGKLRFLSGALRGSLRLLAVLAGTLLANVLSVPWPVAICTPALAKDDRVGLILSQLPPQDSAAYRAIRGSAGAAAAQPLPLTKAEMWSVPKGNVAAVKRAVGEHGALIVEIAPDWNHLLRAAPVGLRLSAQQEAMLQRARETQGTTGVGVVATASPAVVEYALTANAHAKGAHTRPSQIVLALGNEAVTLTRSSVDIRPNMCIWRGVVADSGMPVTILWWPAGKMTGIIQHRGRIYAIRHIGGEMHAVIESREDLMPSERPVEHRPENPGRP
jgi:hypothetical protein